MNCPDCGADVSGRFCSSCGASLEKGTCASCGAQLLPGARFCNQCGNAAARGTGVQPVAPSMRGATSLPWYLLAVSLVAIIVLMFAWLRQRGAPELTATATAPVTRMGVGGAQPSPTGTPPPLTGTPREQADRLFNRIMTTISEGDTTNARFFTPMAIQAYQMAEPLDADGLYHLALIHDVAGDYTSGRAAAERILDASPNHLLGLAAAAEAAERAGDGAAARSYYQRFIAAYDAERARGLPEYQDHEQILPKHLASARRATATGG
jgi:tetratricopeptide (TPR) repeat protein